MAGSYSPPQFTQLVQPRTGTKDGAGWCLRFTQTVYGAPVAYPSAKAASNATKFRHYTQQMPDKSVPVWFDHWGTYGGAYANFGHVVAWVPGHGFLSSPMYGFGQQWFPTILAVERAFNAKFLFWSEDINGLRVAQPKQGAPSPGQEEDDDLTPEQDAMLRAIYSTLTPGQSGVKGQGEIHRLITDAPKKIADATLDTAVLRTGVDAAGNPRTGDTSLRRMIGHHEHQIGLTRRIVERIETIVKTLLIGKDEK